MEEKSETSQRESQTLPSIPKVPKEKEQKTRLPPMRTVRCTPEKCQPPRTWGKWRRVVFTRPFWCKDPPGRRPAEPRPARLPAAPRHPRPRPPVHRQVLALPGAPLPLCGRAAPAGARMPAGQLRRCRAAGGGAVVRGAGAAGGERAHGGAQAAAPTFPAGGN